MSQEHIIEPSRPWSRITIELNYSSIYGVYRGYIGILESYRNNGKENGNYYNGLYRGYIGVV